MAILGGENTTDEMRESQPVCRVHDSPVRLLGRELGTQLGSQRVFSQNVLEYFLLKVRYYLRRYVTERATPHDENREKRTKAIRHIEISEERGPFRVSVTVSTAHRHRRPPRVVSYGSLALGPPSRCATDGSSDVAGPARGLARRYTDAADA